MISQGSTAEISANLEYPACPMWKRPTRVSVSFAATVQRGALHECGLYYLYPRLIESAMQEAYRQSSYYEGGACGYADTSYTDQEFALRATFKRLLQNLAKRGLTGGDLLEIGCGYGYLLDEARSFFGRRVGTEFSPEGAEIARETGAEVFIGGIEQVPSEAKFDCIIGTQVIRACLSSHYHSSSDWSATRRPGGHIILATPDIGGALRKVHGPRLGRLLRFPSMSSTSTSEH